MRFYFLSFLLAYFQSSVLVALFHSMLVAPNLLLVYLFLTMLKENKAWLRRALIAGFFLDVFQDSLGLNLSGFVFFGVIFSLIRQRVDIPSKLSLILTYALLSWLERAWVIVLFRIRYYAELDLWLLPISFALELLFLYFISGRYLRHE